MHATRNLVTALLIAGLTAAILPGCRAQPSGKTTDGRDLEDVTMAAVPPPVASDALGLVAFVSGDGHTVYLWAPVEPALEAAERTVTVKARLAYTVDGGWSPKTMALSPSAGQPYLALTEAFDQGTGAATRVTIVNTATGDYRRVFPKPGFCPQVSSLQWSADGELLFVNGRPPLVVDIAGGAGDIAWDLAAMAPDHKSEARAPLLSPDFKTVAFTRFFFSAAEGADLWVLGEDEGAADQVTTGNVGACPVAWLGAAADGSKPDGPFDFLLAETPHGPAVVDIKSKRIIEWYALSAPEAGETTHRAVLVDLPGRRVLVNSFNAMTGQRARTVWRSLTDGAETELADLAGRHIAGAVGGPEGAVATVVVARLEDDSGSEVWVLDRQGSSRRLAETEGATNVCLVGQVGSLFILAEVSPGGGAPQGTVATFKVTDATGPGLKTVLVTLRCR